MAFTALQLPTATLDAHLDQDPAALLGGDLIEYGLLGLLAGSAGVGPSPWRCPGRSSTTYGWLSSLACWRWLSWPWLSRVAALVTWRPAHLRPLEVLRAA